MFLNYISRIKQTYAHFHQRKLTLISVQLILRLFLIFRIGKRRRVNWTEIKFNLHWWKRTSVTLNFWALGWLEATSRVRKDAKCYLHSFWPVFIVGSYIRNLKYNCSLPAEAQIESFCLCFLLIIEQGQDDSCVHLCLLLKIFLK